VRIRPDTEKGYTMAHIRLVSRKPVLAQSGLLGGSGMDILETITILLLSSIFQGWDNLSAVVQNLQKFYSKT